MDHSGIFTLREFKGREVLKLAPDAYIELNGGTETKIISPVSSLTSRSKSLDMRGGVSSISTQSGVSPGGSSNCTIEIIAPQYKGFHEDYYITMPSGVKVPFFIPMMEVKVFMKGRFFKNGSPIYYQTFWGFIKEVSENYSGGVTTFSLSCGDMLSWWKYQTVSLIPGAFDSHLYGGQTIESAPTIFKDMNPFEIIVKLFTETAFNNFVSPQLSNLNLPPIPGGFSEQAAKFGPLFRKVIDYWSNKYFFSDDSTTGTNRDTEGNVVNISLEANHLSNFLEMYGFSGKKELSQFLNISKRRKEGNYYQKRMESSSYADRIELDFNILEFAQPFGSISNFKVSSAATTMPKLDIANVVSDQVNFEFFLDTNGKFVFKPPFYNLDTKDIETYRIKGKEILNFSAHMNSENLVNFLEVTGPMVYELKSLELVGFHIDFDLVARYGLRHRVQNMMYGNTSKQLRQIAVAEMGRLNGKAFTANLSIPLRPEIRLGYPVYIEHIDAYYYVTGVNHSFNFGSSAQTDLILENRRERLYTEDGGRILKSQVYRLKENANLDFTNSEVLSKEEKFLRIKNISSGFDTGFFEVKPATIKVENSDALSVPVEDTSINSNELVTFTDKTVPFSDINGYRHIGGFPYGANLKLDSNGRTLKPVEINSVNVEAMVERVGSNDLSPEEKTYLNSSINTRLFTVGDNVVSQDILLLPDDGVFNAISLQTTADQLQAQKPKVFSSDTLSAALQGRNLDSRRLSVRNFGSDAVPGVPTEDLTKPTSTNALLNDKIASGSIGIAPKD